MLKVSCRVIRMMTWTDSLRTTQTYSEHSTRQRSLSPMKPSATGRHLLEMLIPLSTVPSYPQNGLRGQV